MACGLILDEAAGLVIATTFPKFFNVGERRCCRRTIIRVQSLCDLV